MISGVNLKIGYEEKVIIDNLNIDIKEGEIVSIIGPNGCGKSTLLKALSRMIKPMYGEVYLEKTNIKSINNKLISQKVCLLSQHNNAPTDMTVEELVYYGRVPHKKWYESKNSEDERIVNWAIDNTGLSNFKKRQVSALSGGERQRAYLAQALAQQPQVLLLDEPTTYLDINHQLELMELVRDINEELKITIVMVLHELNQASKYSDRLIIMKCGKIVCDGCPNEVINEETIEHVYKIKCNIDKDPICNKPRIHPIQTIRKIS